VGIHWDTVKRGITTTHVSNETLILFFVVVIVIIVVIIVVKYIVSVCLMINNDGGYRYRYLLIKMPVLLYITITDVDT